MKHIRRILSEWELFGVILVFSFVCFTGCKDRKTFEFYEFPFGTSDGGIITYYCIYRYNGEGENVVIPDTYNGCEVRYILNDAFSGSMIKEIDIGLVKQIYPNAFEKCNFLERVHLNEAEQIYRCAFLDCKRLETILIPSSVWKIESGAFDRCDGLTSVYFEGNPCLLEEDIFPDNPDLTVFGPSGGALEEYAKSEGIAFKMWEGVL
ncbi:MAG TPA: leucine-rich repeat protein [Candidatus Scatosoma pullicola]|nr:leucine-rich repeat protein [Candidatus Scatosoma pullicola]